MRMRLLLLLFFLQAASCFLQAADDLFIDNLPPDPILIPELFVQTQNEASSARDLMKKYLEDILAMIIKLLKDYDGKKPDIIDIRNSLRLPDINFQEPIDLLQNLRELLKKLKENAYPVLEEERNKLQAILEGLNKLDIPKFIPCASLSESYTEPPAKKPLEDASQNVPAQTEDNAKDDAEKDASAPPPTNPSWVGERTVYDFLTEIAAALQKILEQLIRLKITKPLPAQTQLPTTINVVVPKQQEDDRSEELRGEMKELQGQLLVMRRQLEEKSEDLEDKQKVQQVAPVDEQAMERNARQIYQWEEMVRQLQMSLTSERTKSQQLAAQLQQAIAANQGTQAEMQKLQAALASEREKAQQLAQATNAYQAAQADIQKLQATLASERAKAEQLAQAANAYQAAQAEIQRLQAALTSERGKEQQLAMQLQQVTVTYQALQTQMQQLQVVLANDRSKEQQLASQLQQITNAYQVLQGQVQQLQAALNNERANATQLAARLSQFQQLGTVQQQQLQQLQNAVQTLQSNLAQAYGIIENLRNSLTQTSSNVQYLQEAGLYFKNMATTYGQQLSNVAGQLAAAQQALLLLQQRLAASPQADMATAALQQISVLAQAVNAVKEDQKATSSQLAILKNSDVQQQIATAISSAQSQQDAVRNAVQSALANAKLGSGTSNAPASGQTGSAQNPGMTTSHESGTNQETKVEVNINGIKSDGTSSGAGLGTRQSGFDAAGMPRQTGTSTSTMGTMTNTPGAISMETQADLTDYEARIRRIEGLKKEIETTHASNKAKLIQISNVMQQAGIT